MSKSEMMTVTTIADMLRGLGCDIYYQIRGDKVQFVDRTGKVRMSKWMSAEQAKLWADGFLIGSGHRKE